MAEVAWGVVRQHRRNVIAEPGRLPQVEVAQVGNLNRKDIPRMFERRAIVGSARGLELAPQPRLGRRDVPALTVAADPSRDELFAAGNGFSQRPERSLLAAHDEQTRAKRMGHQKVRLL